jgi:hypothetical protein
MFKVVSDYAYSTLFELIHLRIFLKCAKADEGWLASEVCKYCAVRDNISRIFISRPSFNNISRYRTRNRM